VFANKAVHHTPCFGEDNDLELFIDPDGDRCNYYEFQINAANVINEVFWDYPLGDGCIGKFGWDMIGIKHAVQVQGTLNCYEIEDEGWSVELALPWSAMAALCPKPETNLPPKGGDVWRLNWTRVQKTRHMPDVIRSPQYFASGKEAMAYEAPRIVGLEKESVDWVWSVAPSYSAHIPETWGHVTFSDLVVGED
jgi:hypothetical protein